jgi:pimeloyl-ACP methyl ester carboxylesterase
MHPQRIARIAILLLLIAGCATPAEEEPAVAQKPAGEPPRTAAPPATRSGTVPVNGIDYYYEIHGSGEPLLVLHGGLMSLDMFRPILPTLGAGRQIIAVDAHGHGRTSLAGKHLDYAAQGDDMAVLLAQLGYTQVDVVGYSMGGGIAFRLAAQHPEVVRRLVMVSTPFSRDGFYAEMLPLQAAVGAAMFEQMKATPMYQQYAEVAPHPEEFPTLLDELGVWMRKPYDWSDDVARLTMPTMLVYGDSDMLRPEHEVEFYQLLGGGKMDAGWMREHMSKNRLAILPDATHYDIFDSPLLVPTLRLFLDGKTHTPN